MRTDVAAYADRQWGTFTRAQALTAYSPSEIRTLLDTGKWCTVFRGVYREAGSLPTPVRRTVAAALRLGCRVAACYDTAAQLHHVDILKDPGTHVLSSRRWPSKVTGLIVHTDSVATTDLQLRRGVWTTNRERTAVDLARTYDRLDGLALLDLSLRRGTDRDKLIDELARQAGKRGIRQAIELVGYANPKAESPMESRTRMRCIDAGLPMPEVQFELPMPMGIDRRLDLSWPRWKIGLEYESGEWHTGEAAASRDNPRHNWLVNQGWTMYYATAEMVYLQPNDFLVPIADRIRELTGA